MNCKFLKRLICFIVPHITSNIHILLYKQNACIFQNGKILSKTPMFYQNYLAMRNTKDMTCHANSSSSDRSQFQICVLLIQWLPFTTSKEETEGVIMRIRIKYCRIEKFRNMYILALLDRMPIVLKLVVSVRFQFKLKKV
jgi:hypothetical protein